MVLPWIDVAQAAHKAGFRGDAAATIIAISQPESGRQPDRIVPEPPSKEVPENNESYGLVCVNKLWVLDGHFTKEELLTADGNMAAAWLISEKGTTFGRWMTFGAGLHKPYLVTAKAVMYDRQQRAQQEIEEALLRARADELQALLNDSREARMRVEDSLMRLTAKVTAAVAALS